MTPSGLARPRPRMATPLRTRARHFPVSRKHTLSFSRVSLYALRRALISSKSVDCSDLEPEPGRPRPLSSQRARPPGGPAGPAKGRTAVG